MHGLINRAIQGFARDTYGDTLWIDVTRDAGVESAGFEAMLRYDDAVTQEVLAALGGRLGRGRADLLEDIGTYLVSHPNTEPLRRLLRFGGVGFVDFLHSLDDLPGRARLAVADLVLPDLELCKHRMDRFTVECRADSPGWGHVLVGVLRALADDYGALVLLEHCGTRGRTEIVDIRILEHSFAAGRRFDLGATPEAAE